MKTDQGDQGTGVTYTFNTVNKTDYTEDRTRLKNMETWKKHKLD